MSYKEDISSHILLRLTPSLVPIGTIRGYLVPGTTDTYKLTRLAILKEYRQYGFGRKLVDALHDWAKSHAIASNISPGSSMSLVNTSNTDSQTDRINTQIHQPQLTRQIKINCHSQIYAKGFYSKYVKSLSLIFASPDDLRGLYIS
ncbi:hypothetical protein D9756_000180 [Leucocoprinus leucothites]|uniref:N-acetyltransferase domain-containing protein n=1 Tax=Leucocoprinus leucothites TaxID=201217 RepID=A0A8H5GGH4_9AGAR|nr:hypothetical protein D9756_000180 [Leucoagaricus leucothites]